MLGSPVPSFRAARLAAPQIDALRIRSSILVGVAGALFVADGHQIDVGILNPLVLKTRADFKKDRLTRALVDQMMPVAAVGLEGGGVAGLEHGLAVVLDQHHLACEDVDELVFVLMPMAQGGSGARL